MGVVPGLVPQPREVIEFGRLRLSRRHPAILDAGGRDGESAWPASCFEHDFSENRCPPRIKSGAGLFGIMLYRNASRATPSARLTPTEASIDSGCSAMVRFEPPTSAFAPMPRPSPISPLAPT
jgi:hypothetical protein